jgi:hypothetical protein
MVCDLRSHASANNIPSRFASPVAAEPARAAHSEALCTEGYPSSGNTAIPAWQRTMPGLVSVRSMLPVGPMQQRARASRCDGTSNR